MPRKTYPGYGRELTLRQWAEIFDVPSEWVRRGLDRGLTIEEINEVYNGGIPDMSDHRYPEAGT